MKRIEYFCRNIRHGDPIEEQMEEAKKGGIIKSYTLTTLSAMNVKRNADLCLWCDEIWSVNHIHSCLCVPDHNCMFTCGIDFEVFAFVKVAKEGLKNVVANDSQGEALVHCAEKMFEEMCDANRGIPSEEAIISSAPQMFDELSQSVLSTNPGQIIEEKQDNNALISDFDSIIEIQAGDECTDGYGKEKTQADGKSLSHNLRLMDELYDFKVESNSKLVKDIQPDAHNMLDELPLPTFIKEMAEAAKNVGIDAVQEDYEPAFAVHEVQNDHFTQKQQLFAKLGTLEGSHIRDLVIICANRIRFSTILHSLINDCQHSEKMTHEVDKHYDEKMNSEYHCFEVSMASSIISNAIPHIGLINNVVLPLLWSDPDWFMGSSLSVVLGVNVCKSKEKGHYKFFDPGIGVEVSYNTTLEDKGDFKGEEYTSKEYNKELFTPLTLRSHFSSSRTNKSHLCLCFVFDPGDNVNSSCGCKLWQVGSVEYKSGVVYGVSSYNDAATICLDGYIKLVSFIFGSGDVLNHHRIRQVRDFLSWSIFFPYYKFKASEMKKEFIWDPGIIAKIAYWTSNVLRVGLCKGGIFSKVRLMKLWAAGSMTSIVRATNFDNFEDVSKSFIMSEVPLEHWFIAIRTMLVMKTLAREDSIINCKFPMFMIVRSFVFYPGEWEYNLSHVESLTSKFVQTTEIIPFLLCCLAQLNLLQSSDVADREVAILVFDPGGYGNGKKVHRLTAYQNGGNRFSVYQNGGNRFSVKPCQDYQCYVFDPGGPLMPVNDAMVTNPRPGMCYALAYFKYHLSLILEDKDRFKGRVLIHIKNETKGSLVIYPFCFLFPKSLVAYIRALLTLY